MQKAFMPIFKELLLKELLLACVTIKEDNGYKNLYFQEADRSFKDKFPDSKVGLQKFSELTSQHWSNKS